MTPIVRAVRRELLRCFDALADPTAATDPDLRERLRGLADVLDYLAVGNLAQAERILAAANLARLASERLPAVAKAVREIDGETS